MSQRIPINKYLKEKYGDKPLERTDPFHINNLLKGMVCYGCVHKNKKLLNCDNNCVPWLDLKNNTCAKFNQKNKEQQ
ncbi:MAG: hypothetical protein WC307_06605 [Candidatus Nanoarchaeia archaeon]